MELIDAKAKPTKKSTSPMGWFARKIAYAKGEGAVTVALPSGALAVGDPVTDGAGRVEVGAHGCTVWVDAIGDHDDATVIVARFRQSVAVRWEERPTGGVDAGVFAIWDADAVRSEEVITTVDAFGPTMIAGRLVFAIETGDGHFACVLGFDERNEPCALVAGPGVRPKRFGASVREEDKSDEEKTAEAEARRAAERLAAADVLSELVGEAKPCPITRAFIAGILQHGTVEDAASFRAALKPRAVAFALPTSERKAKMQAKQRRAALLEWALARWGQALAATMPDEATLLARFAVDPKAKVLDCDGEIARIHDQRSSDVKFDLSRPYGHSAALVAAALEDMPREDDPRLGLAGLAAVWNEMSPKDPLKNALWYARAGLLRAIELRILAVRADDVAADGSLRPRDPSYVDDFLAELGAPSSALDALARS